MYCSSIVAGVEIYSTVYSVNHGYQFIRQCNCSFKMPLLTSPNITIEKNYMEKNPSLIMGLCLLWKYNSSCGEFEM